jgi:RNA polymerase sigma-70 factor, ECF subfamily
VDQTSLTLLERLKSGNHEAWEAFDALYRPFLTRWMRSRFSEADCQDLCQTVMVILLRELPRFEHRGQVGSFRTWLRTILSHECSRYGKRQGREACLQSAQELACDDSELTRKWDREHDAWVFNQLLRQIEPAFEPRTWQAFALVKLQGRTAQEAADALGMKVNAVYIACSRVFARLREAGQGFLD